MQDRLVRRVLERPEHAALVVARILEQRERLVGVRRDDDGVEGADGVVVGAQLDAVRRPRGSTRTPFRRCRRGPRRSEIART